MRMCIYKHCEEMLSIQQNSCLFVECSAQTQGYYYYHYCMYVQDLGFGGICVDTIGVCAMGSR